MAHIFEYTVLTAIPDARRGERVNVGVVVFRPDRIDIRFKEASRKLRALTGISWDADVAAAEKKLIELDAFSDSAQETLEQFRLLEPLFLPSSLGSLTARTADEYEKRVNEIIAALIGTPPKIKPEKVSRINTEIYAHFRSVRMMAKPGEDISTGKIVRDFSIAPNEGLSADFALRNGKMHITSTLDLRKQSASLGEAALKSIVLDKSEQLYRGDIRAIGVYAAEEKTLSAFKTHIELLSDYSDDIYNWSNAEGRLKYLRSIYDAASTFRTMISIRGGEDA